MPYKEDKFFQSKKLFFNLFSVLHHTLLLIIYMYIFIGVFGSNFTYVSISIFYIYISIIFYSCYFTTLQLHKAIFIYVYFIYALLIYSFLISYIYIFIYFIVYRLYTVSNHTYISYIFHCRSCCNFIAYLKKLVKFIKLYLHARMSFFAGVPKFFIILLPIYARVRT